ncbi:MAG: electron transfer flavoprotein subunit beta/FixA family protein [Desulfatitalea sp.]|nr:electron transfer flavoprotein subunit beta/FixA family protein [Desulfatitalea sp.]MBI5895470.1 electron transfer flavoprotein subunit beta/FixA family protein [Desulfobacterales bacterium]
MKIVVCIKQVIDVTFPFALDQDKIEPLEADLFYKANPADLCALEAALRLRDAHGGEVIVIGCGPARVEKALKACLAMGADQAMRIDAAHLELNSQAKALLLAKAVARWSPDLILCGSRSLDEGTGETPVAVAEHLGLPQVTCVMALELSKDGGRVIVEKKLERGRRETIECPLPALLSLEAGVLQPRYALLTGMLAAHAARIECLDANGLEIDSAQKMSFDALRRQIRQTLPRPRPKKSFTLETGMTAEQRMEMMMSGGMKKSTGDLLEGSPGDLGKKLGSILQEKAFT